MPALTRPQRNYNWPKLVAALVGTFAALVALAIDANSLALYHVSLLGDMSSRTAWSYGTCMQYPDVDASKALFAGDGLKQRSFLNAEVTSGSTGVCNDFKDAAAKTLIASVHALRYMVDVAPTNAATGDMTTAVGVAYGAIRGDDVTINLDTLSSAMGGLSGIPETCEEIYFKDTDAIDESVQNATAPYAFDASVIKPPNVDCGNSFDYSTQNPLQPPPDDLYAMCIQQFAYLRSRTDNTVDNVPYPGTVFEPAFKPLDMLLPDKWNATLYWDTYSRIFAGVRFGWAAWAATPSIMLSSFMFMDGVCCILAELTRGARMRAMRERANDIKDVGIKITKIEANAAATRTTRMAFSGLGLVVCIVVRFVFVWLPWIGPESYYVRPNCQSGGQGWENNTAEQISDIAVLVMQIIAISSYGFASFAIVGEDPNDDGAIQRGEGIVKSDLRFTKLLWFLIALVTLLRLVLEAIVANAFGIAWAKELIQPKTYDWNANKLAEVVATRVIASAAFASFGGFCLGAVIGRFVVTSSVSMPAFYTFICWIGIVVLSAAPLLLTDVLDLANTDKFHEDCTVLYAGSFEKVACEFRQISLIVVLGALGLVFALLIVMGCATKSRALCTGAKRRAVKLGVVARSMIRTGSAFDAPNIEDLVAFAPAEESRRLLAQIPVVGVHAVHARELSR